MTCVCPLARGSLRNNLTSRLGTHAAVTLYLAAACHAHDCTLAAYVLVHTPAVSPVPICAGVVGSALSARSLTVTDGADSFYSEGDVYSSHAAAQGVSAGMSFVHLLCRGCMLEVHTGLCQQHMLGAVNSCAEACSFVSWCEIWKAS